MNIRRVILMAAAVLSLGVVWKMTSSGTHSAKQTVPEKSSQRSVAIQTNPQTLSRAIRTRAPQPKAIPETVPEPEEVVEEELTPLGYARQAVAEAESPEEERYASIEVADLLTEELRQQGRDEDWAEETERTARETLHNRGLEASVASLECGSTMCRMELDTETLSEDAFREATTEAPFDQGGSAFAPDPENGVNTLTVFFTREGHTLP
ncbi:MAG: hypothetical protein JKY56_07915 [Kofleriaceae bacterium]|nr:hypothetical protein [Kofleriaceae bacterium]